MAAALVVPPTPSPDRLYEAAPPQKSAEPSGRVHSEGGSRTTLLIAGGAVLAFAGGLGIGSLRRRSAQRRSAAELPQANEAPATAATPEPAAATAMPEPAATAAPEPIAEAARPATPTPQPIAASAARAATSPARPPAPAQRAARGARPAAAKAAPRPPAPAPKPEGPVFAPRVAWPDGTESVWRAEITWQSGYRRSEFRALVKAPGAKKATVVAQSAEFRNLMRDPADTPRPELMLAVESLWATLLQQGWTEVPRGGRWFNRRFIWNGSAPPPGV